MRGRQSKQGSENSGKEQCDITFLYVQAGMHSCQKSSKSYAVHDTLRVEGHKRQCPLAHVQQPLGKRTYLHGFSFFGKS